jgi:hypothetical protein
MAASSTSQEELESPGIVVLRTDDQVYQFIEEDGCEWHWNASEGMRIAQASGRKPRAFYPADSDLDAAQLKRQYPDLDEAYAYATDLTKPILFIPFKDGTSVLIDGWHRTLGAILRGTPFLLCYELTEAERDQVLVLKIPPKPKSPRLEPMAPTSKPRPKGGQRKP